MRFPFSRPKFDHSEGEYILPIRFSEEYAHQMLAGWAPLGFGWVTLRARPDATFDLFLKEATLSEDLNLVRLSEVRDALATAVGLANHLIEENDSSPEVMEAAREIKRLVKVAVD